MSKAIPILILTTLLGLVSALWAWSEVSVARDQRDAAQAAQEVAEGRVIKMQLMLREVKSNYATTNIRLDQALRGRTACPTPVSVRNVLCERGNCVPVDSVQTPAD